MNTGGCQSRKRTLLRALVLFFLPVLVLGFLPQVAHAQPAAGQIVLKKGDVQVSQDGGNTWTDAQIRKPLPEGTFVRVGDGGEAALLLADRSQIRLREGSVLELKASGSAPGAKKKKKGFLRLLWGKLWFRNKRKTPKPQFQTPVVVAAIRGTEMTIAVDKDGKTEVVVLEGKVLCSNDKGQAEAGRGQGITTQKDAPPALVTLVKPEAAAQWLFLTPEIKGPADMEVTREQERKGIEKSVLAVRLMVTGNTAAGIKEAEKAVKMAPYRAAPRVALAALLQARGEFEPALDQAKEALSLDPASVPALVRSVELLLGLDRGAEAAELMRAFKGEADARVHMLEGYMALADLDTAGAVFAFNKALGARPDLAPASLGLGLAQYRRGETEKALENMERASLLDPMAAYPHIYLGKAQYELGEREEAEVELNRAAQLDPLDPTPHMYLATMLTDRHQPGKGVLALQKSIFLNNNKLATRSRYLLDQDKASRNVSLAYSLAKMGLHEWARSRGDEAVWTDPTNSAAYLFRASEAVGLSAVDAATLGDIRRARLLQPVNANTYATYNDYQSLLEVPSFGGLVLGAGGTDESARGTASIRGGNDLISFYVEADGSTTDGPKDGTGSKHASGLGRVKGVMASGHELYVEGLMGKLEDEDTRPWQDLRMDPVNRDADNDYWNTAAGYHWRQAPGRDLLALFQARGQDYSQEDKISQSYLNTNITETQTTNIDADNTAWRMEILEFFRLGDHRLSAGGAYESAETETDYAFDVSYSNPNYIGFSNKASLPDHEEEEFRLYVGDIWPVTDRFTVNAGIQWAKMEEVELNDDGKYEDRDGILPHLGVVFKPTEKDSLRAAVFKALQPDYLSGGIQASEVAGFSTITGIMPGTETTFFGLGYDRQWDERTFTRIEGRYFERDYPYAFSSHPEGESWTEEKIKMVRLVAERLITDMWAASVEYKYLTHEAEDPDRERTDHSLGARLTFAHPMGLRVQGALWLVNQDESDDYADPQGDSFVIASVSAEQSLLDKKLLVFARAENILDSDYHYLITETTEANQLPWQSTLLEVGLQWNF